MVLIKLLFTLIMIELVIAEDTHDSGGEKTESNDVLNSKDSEISEVPSDSSSEGVTEELSSNYTMTHKTNASDLKWPLGVVPYYIDKRSYDNIISQYIHKAMKTIERSSCVEFESIKEKPVRVKDTWLYFTNPTKERECVHEPTYTEKGTIIIVLGYECLRRRDVLHTVLHGLGFRDEVSHPQRDQYVRILWENLQPKYRSLFRIRVDEEPHKTLVEYDPMSVMHFHDRAFSTNGGATIAPLTPGLLINPSGNLSQLDIMKLRLYFGAECNKRKVSEMFHACKKIIHKRPNAESKGNIHETVNNVSKDNTEEFTEKDNNDEPEAMTDNGEQSINE